jgi:hypothetical protein
MTLDQFAKMAHVLTATEVQKVRLLAFYFHKTEHKVEFTLADVDSWLDQLHHAKPNASRLRTKLSHSRSFVRGKTLNAFRLHAADIDELQSQFPGIRTDSEEVKSDDSILPKPLYDNTRGFIEALARQINAAYEYNIFDGCAVLMRRLAEILLILSYEHLNIERAIQDASGNYVQLERIVADAKTNSVLRLSRNSKAFMDDFRTLGNFAAHKIHFTTRRADIRAIAKEYRALVEELLYKAGIKK